MNKKLLLVILPLAFSVTVLTSLYFYFKPRMREFVIAQIESISANQLPVTIEIQDLNWNLILTRVDVEGLKITPKAELKDIPEIQVHHASASLDLFLLLTGRIGISSLLLEEPKAIVTLDPFLKSTGPAKPLPIQDLFDLLKKVPVRKIGLLKSDVTLLWNEQKLKVELKKADLLAFNQRNSLSFQIDLAESLVSFKDTHNLPFRIQGDAQLSPTELNVSEIKLTILNSSLTASANFQDPARIHLAPNGNVRIEASSDLTQLQLSLKDFIKLPALKGEARMNGEAQITPKGFEKASFQVFAKAIEIDNFVAGDIQLAGEVKKDQILIPTIAITNEAGTIDFDDIVIGFGTTENDKLSLNLKTSLRGEIDINQLMQNLGVGDIPLELFIKGAFDCQGPLLPSTSLTCSGRAQGDQFEVRSGDSAKDVIAWLDRFSTQGSLTITQKNISYKAELQIKEDRGISDGVISYAEGFKINFASPNIHFKNLDRLAGLKLEGEGSLMGSTQGNSDAATFQMKLAGKDIYFEDFYLGNPQGDIRYQRGNLHFEDLQGAIGSTKYAAEVTVDLNRKRIEAEAQAPTFELQDVFKIFERRFVMPVEVQSSGAFSAKVSGPFELGKLSYDLNAILFRGIAAGESFDRAEFQLHSDSGHMQIKKGLITKNKSTITASGTGEPSGDINIRFQGRNFLLEESENISRLGSLISGVLNFDMSLRGFILNPDTKIDGNISQLFLAEQEFQNSSFEVAFEKASIKGKANLIGGQLKSDFNIPLNDTAPFALNLEAQKWNYATLFALLGAGNLLNDYDAELTGTVNLASERGGVFASTGQGKIQTFQLRRGLLSLQNRLPIELTMKNGVGSIHQFELVGDQSYFNLRGKEFTKDDMRLRLEGQANLRLFQIFVPFLEEFSGEAKIAVDTSGPITRPEILGTAQARDVFVKIKGFPHPFEKVRANVQFSQSKILIDKIEGFLAGGALTGDGTIAIEGPQNLPTSIRGRVTNATFTIPDGVKTTGDADVNFTGSWFPFLLAGTYRVKGGFVDTEFSDSGAAFNLKQSSYLPKIILQGAFEPVLLDLNIVVDNPLTVKNSMIDGAVSGQLQIKGAPAQPGILGRIETTRGSKILFRDKIFEVQTANVNFPSVAEINPELFIAARSRINDYDINLQIQGTAKNPIIRMTSSPPLAERDIISLIAMGSTTQSLETRVEKGQKETGGSNGDALAALVSETAFAKIVKDSFGLDLQISSSYDDTKSTTTQKITIGRKLGERVRVSASQASGTQSTTEVKLQYLLTENVSAIGSFEQRQNQEQNEIQQQNSESILGLDLEFKREFK